jgi:cation diffusion facilitator family transporter
LLLLTCVWIMYEAIQRLFFKSVAVDASVWSFVVMGISILIDLGRSRSLAAAAKKFDSQALEADALHFSTDIWSSTVVIGGLALVLLSEKLGFPWLAKADAISAMGVAGIVVYVSLQLGRKTVEALLDAVPTGLRDAVGQAVRVEGVEDVRQVRIRRGGSETFVEATLTVGQATPLELAHDIAKRAETAVRKIMPGADVQIFIHPSRTGVESLHAAIRRTADRQGAIVHAVRVYEDGNGASSLELHMEVNEALSLEQAHAKASTLEKVLQAEPFKFERVVVHIEPVGGASTKRSAEKEDIDRVLKMLKEIQTQIGLPCDPHDVSVYRLGDELAVSLHCEVEKDMPVGIAHQYTEQLERLMRGQMPELGRVVIHMETKETPD